MGSQQKTLRIDASKLKIGMRVTELDRPWIESPFTVQGFRIKNDKEIQLLKEYCRYVYITTVVKPDTNGQSLQRCEHKDTLTFEQAIPQAKSAHRQAKSVVKGFLNSLRMGQSFDTSIAKKTVKQCVNNVIANKDAMLWLSLLKNVDEYTAEHSINVALLSIVLGRTEGLAPPDLELVGLCGLLHDMGKSEIPLDILNKEGAFSEHEFEVMKSHTSLGYKILDKKSDVAAIVAEVAHCHHERLNGKGYPRGIHADKISYFTRIVAIADAYDAITSQRVYSKAKTALEAITILMGARGSHFDSGLVESFIGCIGVYPSGSIAELSTGEVGIILPTAEEFLSTPRIAIVRDNHKEKCKERLIDLSEAPVDSNGNAVTISHLLSDGVFGIHLSNYHEPITYL